MDHRLLRWGVVLAVGTFVMHVSAATTWDVANNSVTYSVFQDNFQLGEDNDGNYLTQNVSLSQLDMNQVASQEGVGAAANYILSSVVLSMNGTVYGSIKVTNNGASSVSPKYMISGWSMLTYGSSSTPDEAYNGTVTFGSIAPGGSSTKTVNVTGSSTPSEVTITEDLGRFLGTGTIEAIGAFPVYGNFTSMGTMITADISLQGSADISVTYFYDYTSVVPEPSSMVLVTVGCAVLALRRKRVITR